MDIDRLAGTRLGSYEIESLLGRGGMGVVYKARQISLDRPVALKILPPAFSSDPSFVRRFQREARAVARLSHPNIVPIHDIAEEQSLHFFSMEYIEGRTLDELLKQQGRLDPDEAVRIISQAALGIEHAHRNGIIHRDVKPSNIIMDEIGNVRVMDFGLARIAADHSRLTRSGTLMGTLDYMSPEQCRGEELDVQTDIYSLGVVLYEMLTGRAPFEAPNEAALINKIITEEPPEAVRVNPDIPFELNAIVSRSMAKDKALRYAIISEFLEDMRTFESYSHVTGNSRSTSSPSIVVLPFINMSADPEQEYFCDGLAEDLINALTKLQDLRVIARTSAFSFKGQSLDVRDIGRKLDVRAVLEGSVRKAGNRLRITAQLVDTAGGHHLWSEQYNRELDDVFAIQDEITVAIMDSLKPRLLGEEKARLAKRQMVDIEAYNLYLKGRYFFEKNSEEALRKAIEYFEQAIEKAPDYALAYADLAGVYTVIPFFGPSFPAKEAYSKARQAVLKALEIDQNLGEAHTRFGVIKGNYDWDYEGAERAFKKAIELNPGYADAHLSYALHFRSMGRFEEALHEMRQALELDPLSLAINRELASIYYYTGRYDQAIRQLQKTLEMDPSFPYVHLLLGTVYLQKGMHAEAMAAFEKERDVVGRMHPMAEMVIGVMHALMGKKDEARQVLEWLKEADVPPFMVATLYFALGENDQGFEWADKALEERDVWLHYIKIHPLYDLLDVRSDPKYTALLKKIGLDT